MYLRIVLTITVLSTVHQPAHRRMVVMVVVLVGGGLCKNPLVGGEARKGRHKGKSPTTVEIEKVKGVQRNKMEEKVVKEKVRIAVTVTVEITSTKRMEEKQKKGIKEEK